MKRIIIITILLLTWLLLLSQPIIEFETLEQDIGKIKEESGPHQIDFKYINTGSEPLRLLDVKAG